MCIYYVRIMYVCTYIALNIYACVYIALNSSNLQQCSKGSKLRRNYQRRATIQLQIEGTCEQKSDT